VLGASGFLGGWICRELEGSGREFVAAGRADGDLLDLESLKRLLARTRPDAVVNAAGMTSPATALADPVGCFAVNTGGVVNLLEAVRNGAPNAQVIALSSAAVYAGEPPFDESSDTAAITPYAASKLAMETYCGQYSREYGMAVAVVRCFNLIGPGEPAGQASTEFARAALEAGEGGRAEVRVGEPATARDFTDVRDAARALRLAVDNRIEGTFNLCSGEAMSLAEIAAEIGSLTGVELELRGAGDGRPASGLLSISGDPSRLQAETGWRPRISFETSLTDLLASLRA
jgi:GDP-4-dehydro-6-deoxy-D-mannose reductase